jgi:rod shape-determining protein MreC
MKNSSLYTFRRWWDRYGTSIVLISLALGSAWFVRQTQAAVILELYQVLARPFAPDPAVRQQLTNARIQELEARLAETERQNQAFQELMGAVKKGDRKPIFAPVVGRSAHHWWQQLILGRGSQSGLKEGDMVSAPGGLLGRITNVTPHSSQVLLLTDTNSRVGVTIGRTRSMGILRGQSKDRAVMEFFDKVPNVKEGDLVLTSSLSQLFPGGTPVGRVESLNLQASPAPEAVVVLSAPLGSIEWAMVYPKKESSGEKYPGMEASNEPDVEDEKKQEAAESTPAKAKPPESSASEPSASESNPSNEASPADSPEPEASQPSEPQESEPRENVDPQ